MPLPLLLLLLTLLDPSSHLQPWGPRGAGAEVATEPPNIRNRRQVTEWDPMEEDYDSVPTDPPEILENSTSAMTPQLPNETTTQVQGSSQLSTLEMATGDPAGLENGTQTPTVAADTRGTLATEPATAAPLLPVAVFTQRAPLTELVTTEALSTGPATTEAITTGPAATWAVTMGPAATEAITTGPAATEALSTGLAAMEAVTTGPAATGAVTMGPAATEAVTTGQAATEAITTGPAATEALSTGPATTEAVTMGPAAKEAITTGPAATEALSTGLIVMEAVTTESTPRDILSFVPVAIEAQSTEAPATVADGLAAVGNLASLSPPRAQDRIPVKQCLLAILILALVATIFLVCTVVLAVRLSRRNHMYPVRSYSPTEMVCISSLLPEGGDGAAAANGALAGAKSQGPKAEAGEEREGDDLTLHSFLP
ncbi:P-selectin glycoprotein ligand 1 [Erinaceus europaeus]|uniref:P-selectin glycoprotein ligand 1 n=1 Tax=Erinaceus europaeus TaxID=9365 RepID=A0A1S2ZVS9_ERIEU|nr:P-selectin glycoprotein ligand 1 [Erinaceus europaeus]